MKPKILVVDDEADALELVGFNLKRSGFEVLSVKRSTNYVSTDFLARTGFSLVGIKPSLANRVPKFNIPLKLGNLMLVARVRPRPNSVSSA